MSAPTPEPLPEATKPSVCLACDLNRKRRCTCGKKNALKKRKEPAAKRPPRPAQKPPVQQKRPAQPASAAPAPRAVTPPVAGPVRQRPAYQRPVAIAPAPLVVASPVPAAVVAVQQRDVEIKVLQENPKRPGSLSYERYERYKSATTLAQYLERGGTTADFRFDCDRGFVAVEGGDTTPPRTRHFVVKWSVETTQGDPKLPSPSFLDGSGVEPYDSYEAAKQGARDSMREMIDEVVRAIRRADGLRVACDDEGIGISPSSETAESMVYDTHISVAIDEGGPQCEATVSIRASADVLESDHNSS